MYLGIFFVDKLSNLFKFFSCFFCIMKIYVRLRPDKNDEYGEKRTSL